MRRENRRSMSSLLGLAACADTSLSPFRIPHSQKYSHKSEGYLLQKALAEKAYKQRVS